MPFTQVRDLRLYYELHGGGGLPPDLPTLAEGPQPTDRQGQAGEWLVLLNGALDTIESDWRQHLAGFTAHHHVLAYDHRGHGRSDNPPARFAGYAELADDLAALLDSFDITRARFCGFSDGAITLMNFALRWPDRVHSLILAGAQYTNDERTLALLEKMAPERIEARQPEWVARLEQLHDTYHERGYWKELLCRMLPFWQVQPDFTLEQLGQISAPTLLIAGERDGFGHLDQQLAMRRAIPHAELCIAPAAGHFVINDQPALFQLAALDFLRRTG